MNPRDATCVDESIGMPLTTAMTKTTTTTTTTTSAEPTTFDFEVSTSDVLATGTETSTSTESTTTTTTTTARTTKVATFKPCSGHRSCTKNDFCSVNKVCMPCTTCASSLSFNAKCPTKCRAATPSPSAETTTPEVVGSGEEEDDLGDGNNWKYSSTLKKTSTSVVTSIKTSTAVTASTTTTITVTSTEKSSLRGQSDADSGANRYIFGVDGAGRTPSTTGNGVANVAAGSKDEGMQSTANDGGSASATTGVAVGAAIGAIVAVALLVALALTLRKNHDAHNTASSECASVSGGIGTGDGVYNPIFMPVVQDANQQHPVTATHTNTTGIYATPTVAVNTMYGDAIGLAADLVGREEEEDKSVYYSKIPGDETPTYEALPVSDAAGVSIYTQASSNESPAASLDLESRGNNVVSFSVV